jgi:hypothetical protein
MCKRPTQENVGVFLDHTKMNVSKQGSVGQPQVN